MSGFKLIVVNMVIFAGGNYVKKFSHCSHEGYFHYTDVVLILIFCMVEIALSKKLE